MNLKTCKIACAMIALLANAEGRRSRAEEEAPQVARNTHPLLPGIRSEAVWDVNWTRTLHDGLATGFSPLPCAMKSAPEIAQEIPAAGSLNWVRLASSHADGTASLLVDDGRLRLVDQNGQVRWTQSAIGTLLATGDLRGDGGQYALGAAGNQLVMLDLADGRICWRHSFDPLYVSVTGKVADLLPDMPGLEAAIIPGYSEEGYLLNLAPEEGPRIVWQRPVVERDEFDERADHHGGTIELDFAHPNQPVIWNVRRFRCRGFDARTGKQISTLSYDVGGAHRRNYGPMHLGRGADGQLYACVFGEAVQVHVHAIRLHRDADSELAWEHYYGEVYKEAPGVTVDCLGVADLDGDGGDEMIYSVRDPANNYRSYVRGRNIETGKVVFELDDCWGVGLFSDVGAERAAGLVVLEAPNGETPRRGALSVYRFNSSGPPTLAGNLPRGGAAGPLTVPDGESGTRRLLLRTEAADGEGQLAYFDFEGGQLRLVAETHAPAMLAGRILNSMPSASGDLIYLIRSGRELTAVDWNGAQRWSVPLEGGDARISAADLDGDGRAEIVAAMSDQTMRVYGLDDRGEYVERTSFEHFPCWHSAHHPVLFDLEGEGQLCILAAGDDAEGRLVVRAHRPDGSILWETPLPVAAEEIYTVVFNAGRFLESDHAGVTASITDHRRIREGTYMLDGRTGRIVWSKGFYRNGDVIMPYRPNGIPTADDIDGDGVDEVGMDLLSYMAFLRGRDGEFALLYPTANLTREGSTFAGYLYSTFCPLFKTPGDRAPHWLATAGYGTVGLMNPDPTQGTWRDELGYDSPTNLGLVDVDGDGSLEVGYAPQNHNKFFCRDVWTGKIKWILEFAAGGEDARSDGASSDSIPSRTVVHAAGYRHPNGAIVTADFNGDGRGEFFDGEHCINVDQEGVGQVLWRAPCYLNWPIVADFDGDGLGEIAGVSAGRIVVLKARP